MKIIQLLLLAILSLPSACCMAENQPLPAELAHALVQAKSVYIVTGHVDYYSFKGKHFIKPALVETTPFDQPCREALDKWGRFSIVSSPADADLVVRVYMTGSTSSVPVISPGVTGTVDVEAEFVVLEVVQRVLRERFSGPVRKTSPGAGARKRPWAGS